MKKVSIIVVNYNTTHELGELLVSLHNQSYDDYELIVIDNASSDRDIEELATEYAGHRFIFLKENLGFAGANNVGIRASEGEYVFLLNADTLLQHNSIEELVSVLDAEENAGAVSPRLIYHKEQLIQYAGSTPISSITVQNEHRGNRKSDLSLFSGVERTAFNHGAAMMIKRSAIEKVGLMPEEYFLYYEELDWCTAFKKAGYDLYYTGRTSIQHKASASTSKIVGLKSYYLTRNRLLFVLRNYESGVPKLLAISYLLLIVFPKNLLMNLNDFKTMKSLCMAVNWNISYLFNLKLNLNKWK